MLDPRRFPVPRLLTPQDLADPDPLPNWLPVELHAFRSRVLDPNYPCYFGTAAEKRGELRYTWLDSPDDARLAQVLTEFADSARSAPEVRYALIVFVAPKAMPAVHEQYRNEFWSILQTLHDADPVSWPSDVPLDTDHPDWEFCFAGLPMFVFGAAPSYHNRRSRNLSSSLMLLFQPRSVFVGIEGGTVAGDAARRKIRERLSAWDAIDAHPDFGDYGEPSNHEWKQYFVADDNIPEAGRCPLQLRIPLAVDAAAVTRALGLLPAHGSIEIHRDPPGYRHPIHTHPTSELIVVLAGAIDFEIEGMLGAYGPGDVIALPAHTPHRSFAGKDGAIYAIRA